MKTPKSPAATEGGSPARLVRRLVIEARDRKRRMLNRRHALKGDEIRTPSRGPVQPNGRNCIRWHFYESAKANHAAVTEQITHLVALLPNDPDQLSGDSNQKPK